VSRIWLEDVAAELFKAGNNGQLELVGFDVADTLFTRVNPAGVKLVISDIHEGFPEEYHGTFDVVHLRLLLVVITEEQMPNAVSNLVKLLSKIKLGFETRESRLITQQSLEDTFNGTTLTSKITQTVSIPPQSMDLVPCEK
jgi:hypothetical protein